MIDYMNWVREIFPSITPNTHERALASIKEFIRQRGHFDYLMPTPLPIMTQGDIVSNIPFYYYNEEGDLAVFEAPAMLLSTTCDAENDQRILFSPLISIAEFISDGFDEVNIKKNLYTCLLYIPDLELRDYTVDMTIVSSVNREVLMNALESGSIKKIGTLSLKGYYFFLSKLTVHLMRPEVKEAIEMRTA